MHDLIPDLPPQIPLLALYAETHFRFSRLLPSLVYRRQPEVVFDMPRRIGPGHDLPVLLIVNDIDRFPTDVDSVAIAFSGGGSKPRSLVFSAPSEHALNHPLSFQSRAFLFLIPRSRIPGKNVYVNAKATLKCGGKTLEVLNDNFPTTAKAAFQCCLAEDELPGSEHCCYGDLHVHSQFSQSHVEFGPPVEAIQAMTRAYGADFVGITDHSYDLACALENYLAEDPHVPRWEKLRGEVDRLSNQSPMVVLGEEVSCLNSKGRTVHLCGLGMKHFIPGSADGARRHATRKEMLPIPSVISRIQDDGGVSFAAHPGSVFGWLQRLLLHRGAWSPDDLDSPLDGMQAVNSGFHGTWRLAKRLWIAQLLKGHRTALVSGNDSHGDFNRYRSLKIPFVQVNESTDRHFCSTMTGVYTKPESSHQLLDCLRDGKTFVTEGPFITISSSPSPNDSVVARHDTAPEPLYAVAVSNPEYGVLHQLAVIHGSVGGTEQVVLSERLTDRCTFQCSERIGSLPSCKQGYLRAELATALHDGGVRLAFTSPCYYNR